MTVPETVLDRLNYFNGQRLEATDFRAEQAYHMAVRRALNRAPFSVAARTVPSSLAGAPTVL